MWSKNDDVDDVDDVDDAVDDIYGGERELVVKEEKSWGRSCIPPVLPINTPLFPIKHQMNR